MQRYNHMYIHIIYSYYFNHTPHHICLPYKPHSTTTVPVCIGYLSFAQ